MKKRRLISKRRIFVVLVMLVIMGISLVYYGPDIIKITKFELVDNTLYMNRVISTRTPEQVYEIFAEYPNIDTIVLENVPGSINDDANLEIANWLIEQDITTRIERYGEIASGGTDMFFIGDNRIVVDGATIGVHSWGSSGVTATDFARGHEYHQPYIDFYIEAGLTEEEAENFYYFTIEAAPYNGIHWMTNDEIIDYKLSTTSITEPEFVVSEEEEKRQRNGFSYISDEEAAERGIEVISRQEYRQRKKAQNRIRL